MRAKGAAIMACELFEAGRRPLCRAVAGTLIPSVFERERYCCSDGSLACPTRRLYHVARAPLSQETYFALWTASPERPTPPASL
jgi:hypothetical protein